MDYKNTNLSPEAAEWVENEFNPIAYRLNNLLCVLKDHLYTEPMTPALREAGVYSVSNCTDVLIATPVVGGHWLVCRGDNIVLHGTDGTWNIILPILNIKGSVAVPVEANAHAIEGKLLKDLRKLTRLLAGQLDEIDKELTVRRTQAQ